MLFGHGRQVSSVCAEKRSRIGDASVGHVARYFLVHLRNRCTCVDAGRHGLFFISVFCRASPGALCLLCGTMVIGTQG